MPNQSEFRINPIKKKKEVFVKDHLKFPAEFLIKIPSDYLIFCTAFYLIIKLVFLSHTFTILYRQFIFLHFWLLFIKKTATLYETLFCYIAFLTLVYICVDTMEKRPWKTKLLRCSSSNWVHICWSCIFNT